MSDKTKAAMPGRQCGYACQRGKITRLAAGGQRGSDSGVSTHCAKLRSRENQRVNGYQPFGSMPRLSSSLRNMRLIQPERLSSPSSFMAILSLSKRSASRRSCTANLSFLLSSVDIVNLEDNNAFEMTMYTNVMLKATPRSGGTLPRRLTSNVKETNAMAKPQCTQTRPEYSSISALEVCHG